MRISARADYALRACIELARSEDVPSSSDAIAQAQGIPQQFVQRILGELRQAGFVDSTRGGRGGYRLACPPEDVTVADIVRAMDGPLVRIHGVGPYELRYPSSTEDLASVWIAVHACLGAVLDGVTLSDLATGRLPALVSELGPRSAAPRSVGA